MSFQLAQGADPLPSLPGTRTHRGRRRPLGSGVEAHLPCEVWRGHSAAREKFKQRVYVDLLCGPGRIQVKGQTMTRPGGAQLAWQHSRRDGADFTSCLVGDLDARARAPDLEPFANVLRSLGDAREAWILCQFMPLRHLEEGPRC